MMYDNESSTLMILNNLYYTSALHGVINCMMHAEHKVLKSLIRFKVSNRET